YPGRPSAERDPSMKESVAWEVSPQPPWNRAESSEFVSCLDCRPGRRPDCSVPGVEAELMVTAVTQPSSGRRWLLLVSALSLPAVAFVPLPRLVVVGYYGNSPPLVSGPTALDSLLLWPVFLTGAAGGWLALAALATALVGSFRRDVPAKTKLMIWGLAILSALGGIYILLVPNLMALVK